jgi:hypothetical protein
MRRIWDRGGWGASGFRGQEAGGRKHFFFVNKKEAKKLCLLWRVLVERLGEISVTEGALQV